MRLDTSAKPWHIVWRGRSLRPASAARPGEGIVTFARPGGRHAFKVTAWTTNNQASVCRCATVRRAPRRDAGPRIVLRRTETHCREA